MRKDKGESKKKRGGKRKKKQTVTGASSVSQPCFHYCPAREPFTHFFPYCQLPLPSTHKIFILAIIIYKHLNTPKPIIIPTEDDTQHQSCLTELSVVMETSSILLCPTSHMWLQSF